MKLNFSTLITALLLAVWIAQAIRIALSETAFTWKAGLNFLTSACLTIGALGFFGASLSATGGLDWLPDTFEWPVGNADNVLITNDGTYIVPHPESGRIQIYNADLEFQRGWPIKSNGGEFKLSPSANGEFDVYVARSDHKYHYDIYGKLLSTGIYESGEYAKIPDYGENFKIPTPVYLYVFTHPFASLFVAAMGIFLLSKARKLKNMESIKADSNDAKNSAAD
ncbi:MAG: hypothetical protein ACYSWO_13010 [Planctomycetota bacterium]|jgi:hypothetical protein